MPFHYRNMAAVILAATLLMLAGCSSPAEKAQTSLSDIEELQTSVMESFTQLADLENSLQTEFEAALTEDESLSTLSDGSAEVHANIEERGNYWKGCQKAMKKSSASTKRCCRSTMMKCQRRRSTVCSVPSAP